MPLLFKAPRLCRSAGILDPFLKRGGLPNALRRFRLGAHTGIA